ncbi:outer membrane lipoprotein carrier protein LolA [Notoacmeibacter ruber]|uniref:Outer membrane lipoprotein carrier protein LolA n=1 Tax=Notoacmeibacter ruber TaxID=2670375 RepID=A0A3L7JEU5_9HYPH|nr:outer membrane lipoprotein carrier protein LolA [Notoacmeibacter ruber]RLQ89000.1 outer membrane lipoprotein carrier protein LolA [Notoacmeibacter ruber]
MIKTMRPFKGLAVLAVSAGLALSALGGSAQAAASAKVQQIANHFASVKTMKGEFVQFGPRGEQTGGTFQIARPGKISFDYEPPAKFRVISDGRNLLLNNQKLDTFDLYPLSKTPLKLLLNNKINLSGRQVQSIKEEPDLVTVVMADKSVFGNSRITIMFDPKTNALRQWTVTDNQGKDTTVMLFNVQEGARVDSSQFRIDYSKYNWQSGNEAASSANR